MPLDLAALRYLGFRLFNGSTDDPRHVAHAIRKHAPAGHLRLSAPIHLPDQLDRIISVCGHSTRELERQRLFADKLNFPATELFELRDAAVIHGRVYSRNARINLRDTKRRFGHFIPRLLPLEPSGFVGSTVHSWNFFGHWLTDQLATEWLGASLGAEVFASDRRFVHLEGYRSLMNWYPTNLGDRQFRKLTLARDVGQNPSRVARQRAMRNLLRSMWPESYGNKLVYISRGQTGSNRALVNEAEIEAFVHSCGGTVLYPESLSVKALASALGNAEVVAGVEGSALTHALLLAPSDCTLLTIQPPRRFHNILKVYTDGIGQRYSFAVADDHAEGFSLPCARLEQTLELIERRTSHVMPVHAVPVNPHHEEPADPNALTSPATPSMEQTTRVGYG